MTRPVPPYKVTIDPAFPPPRGAGENFEYSEDSWMGEGVEEVVVPADEGSDIDDQSFESDTDETDISPPDSFVVVSQTLRRSSNGQMVVDIVLDVEDVLGADRYEFRAAP